MKSAVLSKRVRQLEGFVGALEAISSDIRYFASPVDVLMRKIDSLPEYRELLLFGLCAGELAHSRDLQKAWGKALQSARPRLALDDGDIETLTWFGRVLGTTDVEGQTASCERYAALLRQRLESARRDRQSRGRLYTSLGLLTGIFVCVVFI